MLGQAARGHVGDQVVDRPAVGSLDIAQLGLDSFSGRWHQRLLLFEEAPLEQRPFGGVLCELQRTTLRGVRLLAPPELVQHLAPRGMEQVVAVQVGGKRVEVAKSASSPIGSDSLGSSRHTSLASQAASSARSRLDGAPALVDRWPLLNMR